MGLFSAFTKLSGIKQMDQQIDDKIGRLASLAGYTNNELNTIVRLTVVNDFPDNISANLQQA